MGGKVSYRHFFPESLFGLKGIIAMQSLRVQSQGKKIRSYPFLVCTYLLLVRMQYVTFVILFRFRFTLFVQFHPDLANCSKDGGSERAMSHLSTFSYNRGYALQTYPEIKFRNSVFPTGYELGQLTNSACISKLYRWQLQLFPGSKTVSTHLHISWQDSDS